MSQILVHQTHGPLIYRVTRKLAMAALAIFYDEINVIGQEHLPANGPVVLVANHPNHIVDAAVIATQTHRQIHFIAKGQLLEMHPILSQFLRVSGMIPVFRPQDGLRRMGRNNSAFRKCADLLDDGAIICIFAEGESHREPKIRTLRVGAARIILEAEARQDYKLNASIIPVGLYFPEGDRYFSKGAVIFGKPMNIHSFCEQHREHPGRAAVNLTTEMSNELRKLTLHIPNPQWAAFVKQTIDLQQINTTAPLPIITRLRRSQAIVKGIESLTEHDPKTADKLRADMNQFWHLIGRDFRKKNPSINPLSSSNNPLKRLWNVAQVLFALFGLWFNAVPQIMPIIWSRIFVQNREKHAFIKFMTGVPLTVAWYLLTIYWVRKRSIAGGFTLMIIGPISGITAIRMRIHQYEYLRLWRLPIFEQKLNNKTTVEIQRKLLLARISPWLERSTNSETTSTRHNGKA